MQSDKLREIAEYHEETYECQTCGVISTPQDIIIDEVMRKDGTPRKIPQYNALCPDCSFEFGRMKKTKAIKFFYSKKVGTVSAAELDLGQLRWLIKVGHFCMSNDDARQSILERIMELETTEPEIQDFELDKTKEALQLEIANAEKAIEDIDGKIARAMIGTPDNYKLKYIKRLHKDVAIHKGELINLKNKYNGNDNSNNSVGAGFGVQSTLFNMDCSDK